MTTKNSLEVLQDQPSEWYQDGLRFKCTGCGKCCTGAPGAVWISDEEIQKISDHLGLSVNEFLKKYTRLIDGKRSLLEDSKTYDCIFLEGSRCSIYSLRPLQCQTYPWWPNNLRSKQDWDDAAKWCEGINHPESDNIPISTIHQELNRHIDGGGH